MVFFGCVEPISDIFGGNACKAKVLNRFSAKFFWPKGVFGHAEPVTLFLNHMHVLTIISNILTTVLTGGKLSHIHKQLRALGFSSKWLS